MYRFYIDGNLQNSEELKWEDVSLGMKRYEDFNALFFEYATGLEFSGATYEYMKGLVDANLCDEVTIRVLYRCNDISGQFTTLFEGTIFLSEAEWDLYNCKVMCEAEDESYSSRLIALKDKEIPLDGTVSQNGTTITPPTVRSVTVFHPTTSIGTTRNMYKVIDVFTYLMQYITNGNSAVNSNLFSTAALRQVRVITFTTPAQIATGTGNLVIRYICTFGYDTTVTVPIQATALNTLRRIAYALHPNYTGDAQADYYTNSWKQYPNSVTHNGVDAFTCTTNYTFRIVSITGASFTQVQTQAATVGAENLMMCSGVQMRGTLAGSVPSISFLDLWREMDKIFNLGFTLINVNGVATMQIEQISEFFSSGSSSISLLDVPNVKRKRSLRFSYDSVKVGDGGKKQGKLSELNDKAVWTAQSGTCASSQSRDCKSEWVMDHDRVFQQRTTTSDQQDDDIFLLECYFSVTYKSLSYAETQYTNTAGASQGCNAYNAQLSNYYKVINSLFSSVGDMTGARFGPALLTIENDTVPRFVAEYELTSPMTLTSFLTIKNDASNFLTFSPTQLPQDGGIGYIDSVEHKMKNSETSLTLIST